jgi:hypothetical protein
MAPGQREARPSTKLIRRLFKVRSGPHACLPGSPLCHTMGNILFLFSPKMKGDATVMLCRRQVTCAFTSGQALPGRVAKLREGGLAALRELRAADDQAARAEAAATEDLKVRQVLATMPHGTFDASLTEATLNTRQEQQVGRLSTHSGAGQPLHVCCELSGRRGMLDEQRQRRSCAAAESCAGCAAGPG